MDLYSEQIKLEEEQHAVYQKSYYKNLRLAMERGSVGGATKTLVVNQMILLRAAIKDYIAFTLETTLPYSRGPVGNFLCSLDDDEIIILTFVCLTQVIASSSYMSNNTGISLQSLARKIGNGILDELNFIDLADSCQESLTGINVYDRVNKIKGHSKKKKYLKYISWHDMFKTQNDKDESSVCIKYTLSFSEKIKLGLRMIELIESKLGLIRLHRRRKGYKKNRSINNDYMYNVLVKPEVFEMIKEADSRMSSLGYAKYPMVCKPKPWTTLHDGGYYTIPGHFIRLKYNMDSKAVIAFYKNKKMPKVLEAVNILQEVPWKINTKVYDVLSEVLYWNNSPIKDIPSQYFPEPPERPESFEDEDTVKAWKLDMYKYYKKNNGLVGKRCRVESVMSFAKNFRKYDQIYFPCNVDFRGRIYPIPAYNFQGDDMVKGLLCFANGDDVSNDETAIKWLKVNLANHYGLDKAVFDERIKWVNDNMGVLRMIARDPVANYELWCNADCPVQFLAACLDFIGVIDRKEPSHIKVSFDGSCSGIQHYSAMFRDDIGGRAVNLIPDDKVNDIYKIVADKVVLVAQNDAINGVDDVIDPETGNVTVGTKRLANEWLRFGITRSIVKRCVMTFPYGSKSYGFQNHIYDDHVKDTLLLEATEFREVPFTRPRQSAIYLGTLVFEAVKTSVVKAYEGMEWLRAIAGRCSLKEAPVWWVTPSGFYAYQDYRKEAPLRIQCIFREGITIRGRVRLSYNLPTEDQNKIKQANSIAPNFIHSMDASHMHLALLAAKEAGIKNLGMVHDDFGTSAKDADKMFNLIRDTFIDLYNKDIVGDLYEQFAFFKIPEPPEKGTLDINDIKKSLYSFH